LSGSTKSPTMKKSSLNMASNISIYIF